jgi:molecular chaperone DnaK
LNEAEIQRMVKEAEANKSEDEKRKNVVNARNTLDGLIYSIEKSAKENADKLEAALKDELNAAIEEAKKSLDSTELDVLTAATEKLTQTSNKMAEVLYKNTAQADAAAAGASAGPGAGDANATDGQGSTSSKKSGDDVIDADFKEV